MPKLTSTPPRQLRGYLCVASSVLGNLVRLMQSAGLMLCAGMFFPYIASYLYERDSEMEITTVYNAHTYVLLTDLAGVCKSYIGIAQFLARRLPVRLVLFGITTLAALVFLLVPFVESTFAFVLIFAVNIGILSGSVTALTIYPSIEHFPDRAGLVTGVILLGFGGGPTLWNILLMSLFNPNDLPPDVPFVSDGKTTMLFGAEVAQRLPYAFRVIALIVFLMGAINAAGFFTAQTRKEASQNTEVSMWKLVFSRSFMCVFLAQILSCAWWLTFLGVFKEYALSRIPSDSTVTTVTTIASMIGLVGRFLWPTLMDRFGYKKVMIPLAAVNMGIVILLPPLGGNPIYFGVLCSLTFLTAGGFYPCFCASLPYLFGAENASKLYSIGVMYQPIDGLIYMVLVAIIDIYGYSYLWYIMEGALIFAAAAMFSLDEEKPKEEEIANFEYHKLE